MLIVLPYYFRPYKNRNIYDHDLQLQRGYAQMHLRRSERFCNWK